MVKINEANFITELLLAIPEFKNIHEEEKEYHEIGVNTILSDLKCFAENYQKRKNQEMLKRIAEFILRCDIESRDEVKNAIWVSFFETMNEDTIQAICKYLQTKYYTKFQEFLTAVDETSRRGAELRRD